VNTFGRCRDNKPFNKVNSEDATLLHRQFDRLFYIYDWPSAITDRWPDEYSHHRLAASDEFKQNFGCGPLKNSTAGLYHTHQYSLFLTLYHRLYESTCRTDNPADASLFFIPFDLGNNFISVSHFL
jgi:hypothetical protein